MRKYPKHVYLTKDLFLDYIKNYYDSIEDKQPNFLSGQRFEQRLYKKGTGMGNKHMKK